MDIHFFEPDEMPLPREEVRVRGIATHPYPDGRRVRLDIDITPFQDRPNIDVEVFDSAGRELASLNIIESMESRFDITVHLRGPQPRGRHTARVVVFYPDTDLRDQAEETFDLPT